MDFSNLSQYVNNPTEDHCIAITRALRYIQYNINYCLQFEIDPYHGLFLTGYCNSDFASSDESRRSTTCYRFTMNKYGSAIFWKSMQQSTVALSSTEVEYTDLSDYTQEALYLKLCKEIDPSFLSTEPILIYKDGPGYVVKPPPDPGYVVNQCRYNRYILH